MRREVPGRIAMQPEKNLIRGFFGELCVFRLPEFAMRPGLWGRIAMLPQYSGRIADADFNGSSNFFYLGLTRGEIPPRAPAGVDVLNLVYMYHQGGTAVLLKVYVFRGAKDDLVRERLVKRSRNASIYTRKKGVRVLYLEARCFRRHKKSLRLFTDIVRGVYQSFRRCFCRISNPHMFF
jgi:hypothetical protein